MLGTLKTGYCDGISNENSNVSFDILDLVDSLKDRKDESILLDQIRSAAAPRGR